MEAYLTDILSFPTIIYTLFLCLCVILGLLTIIGGFSADTHADCGDICDVGDVGGGVGDIGGVTDMGDFGGDGSDASSAAQAVGILTRLGLNGVPITIVVTLLSLFGWAICYLVQALFLSSITVPIIYYGLGMMLMVSSFMVSVFLTAQCCKPLRKAFRPTLGIRKRQLIGQTVVIDSLRVDMNYGFARYENKGTSLHLKIRAIEDNSFKRGEQAVLLQYSAEGDYYLVISEDEFLKKTSSQKNND